MNDDHEGLLSETTLRARARAAIRAGKIPRRPPQLVWGGRGEGDRCAVCNVPVRHDETEFEIEQRRDGNHPVDAKYHVHVRCFAAWEIECQSLELADSKKRVLPAGVDDVKMPVYGSDPASRRGQA